MKEYSNTVKARMIARLLRPNGVSASVLSKESGISQATLSRWLKGAATIEPVANKRKQRTVATEQISTEDISSSTRAVRRTGAKKLAVVQRAAGLQGEALGAFLRHEGIHLAEFEDWCRLAEEALNGVRRPSPSKELRRVKAELARKEKALAETAALIVLKKKVEAIWGDGDDDTNPRSES